MMRLYSNYFVLLISASLSGTTTVAAWTTSSSSPSSSSSKSPLLLLSQSETVSRRQVFHKTLVTTTSSTALIQQLIQPQIAHAGIAGEDEPRVTTRMGGLLEPFQDGPRGLRIMAPSGWNKFEGEVGAYDIKWQDLVDPTENIKISSSPVKSTTESIDVLGSVQDLGPKLAAKRNAKLLSATDRTTEGILFYTFDFEIPSDKTHQLLLLCVAKGKLWSVDASAKEKRWSKRSELYKNVLGSFVPRLNAV